MLGLVLYVFFIVWFLHSEKLFNYSSKTVRGWCLYWLPWCFAMPLCIRHDYLASLHDGEIKHVVFRAVLSSLFFVHILKHSWYTRTRESTLNGVLLYNVLPLVAYLVLLFVFRS